MDADTSIVGIHLEGPFINKKYGSFTDNVMEYSDAICERLFSLAAPYMIQCTYGLSKRSRCHAEDLPQCRPIAPEGSRSGSAKTNV